MCPFKYTAMSQLGNMAKCCTPIKEPHAFSRYIYAAIIGLDFLNCAHDCLRKKRKLRGNSCVNNSIHAFVLLQTQTGA